MADIVKYPNWRVTTGSKTQGSNPGVPARWASCATADLPTATSGPHGTGPIKGDQVFDTTRNVELVWTGSAWDDAPGSGNLTFDGSVTVGADLTVGGKQYQVGNVEFVAGTTANLYLGTTLASAPYFDIGTTATTLVAPAAGGGVKIGGATTEEIGFYNATPVAQPAGTVDVLASLVTLGLRAASSNPPLDLGTGQITCGGFLTLGAGTAVTATVDGLTTGVISSTTTFAVVSVGTTNHIATLPTPALGKMLFLVNVAASNNLEVQTAASSNITINNVDADGTNQLDVAAGTMCLFVGTSATNWACVSLAPTPDND